MKKFAVEIHGRGFPVTTDGGKVLDGFVVTVFVEAEDEINASEIALRSIVESKQFDEEVGIYADPERAEVFVAHWFELISFDGCSLPHSGFIFFETEAPLH